MNDEVPDEAKAQAILDAGTQADFEPVPIVSEINDEWPYQGSTKRPDPPGSSARARLESVTRIRGLVETAHNYLGRTPSPPHPMQHNSNAAQSQFEPNIRLRLGDYKEAALDAFDELERILVRWQGFEQDKLG